MELDKYYQDMIDNILNGASDREQLEIILKLVSGLKEWNMNCGGYCELLYYKGFNEIQHKINNCNFELINGGRGLGVLNAYMRLQKYSNNTMDFNIESNQNYGTTIKIKLRVIENMRCL